MISFDDEAQFWEKGVFGYDSPKALQRAVFYVVGLHFVLRGIQEHYDLQVEQLRRMPSETYVHVLWSLPIYTYVEFNIGSRTSMPQTSP